MLKGLLRRAHEVAHKHLPERVRDGGRRLADAVLERAPRVVQETVAPLLRAPDAPDTATPASCEDPTSAAEARDFRDTQQR